MPSISAKATTRTATRERLCMTGHHIQSGFAEPYGPPPRLLFRTAMFFSKMEPSEMRQPHAILGAGALVVLFGSASAFGQAAQPLDTVAAAQAAASQPAAAVQRLS